MSKGIRIVGSIMVAALSLVSLVSGLDRRYVSYFIAFGIPILLIGGWIIALFATHQPSTESKPLLEPEKAVRHPGRGLGRGIGVIMIVVGALTFYSIAGIFSLFVGIGLVKLKAQSYTNAITLLWVEIVASSLALVAGIVQLINVHFQVVTVMHPIINKYIALVVLGIIGLVISIPLLVLLNRPVVREAYRETSASTQT